MFLVNIVDRDAVVNQLCSVIMPPIFLYVVLMHFFGEKYANTLLRKDTYNKKRIRIRLYGIVRMTGICLFLLFLIAYFALYKAWDMAVVFVIVLLGYVWIKLRTYSARLEYTHRHLIFCTGKKREEFSWKDVTRMSWTSPRGSIAYSLRIEFGFGLTADLSSSDFVGLTKLKAFFDEGFYKT